jgi:hypothetical protein
VIEDGVGSRQSIGFLDIRYDDDGKGITLRWAGAVPAVVKNAVVAAASDAPVRIQAVSRDRVSILRAVKAVSARLLVDGPAWGIHGVAGNGDTDGVDVFAVDPNVVDVAAIRRYVPSDIPLNVVQMAEMKLASRLDDSSPYYGGGKIQTRINTGPNTGKVAGCSAGFGVLYNNTSYILTAGHCGGPGMAFYDGGWNFVTNGSSNVDYMGQAAYENVSHDLLLIQTGAAGRIWDGQPGVNEFTKHVIGWASMNVNESVCQSGVSSAVKYGPVCGLITSSNFSASYTATDDWGNRETYTDLVTANRSSSDGKSACIGGDSGGPVFKTSGTTDVIAKGTVSGSSGTTQCVIQDFVTARADFSGLGVLG